VEVARAGPVSEGIYNEGVCKGNQEDVGIGSRGVGWAISSDASLSGFLVTYKNWENV
jgi:hypothetical protein